MTLLAATLNFNSKIKSLTIWSDTKSKSSNVEDGICRDGPNSEFKVVSHFLRVMLLCVFKCYKSQ